MHTPGPWEVGELDKNNQRIVCAENLEVCTCWHHCVGSIEKEMEANARLIAAAPDLLEALVDLIEDAERQMKNPSHHQPFSLNKAKAAIAAAKGEG